jgi:hypothetical protein
MTGKGGERIGGAERKGIGEEAEGELQERG